MLRILLIMPFFMGYEKRLETILKNTYSVTLLDSEQFSTEIRKRYCSSSKLRWGVRKLSRSFRESDQEKAENIVLAQALRLIDRSRNAYDIILGINGAYLPNKFYLELKEGNPNARVLFYAWDDLSNLFKTSHITFFEEQYSYNIEDCRRRNMHYLPVFVQEESKGHAKTDQYDITYIASAYSKERVDFADMLFAMYGKQYRLFIYLYDPQMSSRSQFAYREPLSNSQYIDILRRSKAILDVPAATQHGPTTRAFDALLTKTKVITTNKHMKEYPIYSENILIIDKEKPVIDAKFMSKSYMQTDYQCMNVEEWIHALGL